MYNGIQKSIRRKMDVRSARAVANRKKDFRVIVVGFIIIGVTGVFLFLMIASPLLAMRLLTSSSKNITLCTKKTVEITARVAMKSVNAASSVVIGTAERSLQLVELAGNATMDAIQLVADVIVHLTEIVPPITGMVVRNIDDLFKIIILCNSTISGFMGELLDSGIGGVLDIINQGLALMGSIGEFTSFLVNNAFIPATQALTGINEIVTASTKALTETQLPRLLSAIEFLVQSSNSQIVGDIQLTIISSVVGLFAKVFGKFVTSVTKGEIINTIISSVTGVLKSINLNVLGSFDICGVIISIIEPALSLLNFIPGLSTINKCVPDFIRLGLWWMTQGSFCASRNPITSFTNCLLGEIGNVTIIPAFNLELSIRSLVGNIPGIPSELSFLYSWFDDLLSALPKVSFGWTNISLNTILSNLEGVLVFLFTDLKTIFKSEAGGTLISFTPSPGLLLLPQVLLFVVFKVATEFMTKIVDLIYGENGIAKQALKIIDSWAGCVEFFGFPIYYPKFKSSIPFVTYGVEYIGARLCISTIFGPIITLYEKIFSLILSQLATIINVGDLIFSFLGVEVPNIDAQTLTNAINRALGQLSNNLNLPFYFRT